MPHEDLDAGRLSDMLVYAREIVETLRGVSFPEYVRDKNLRLATERRIEIIGEAARRVSEETRRQLPQLPWQDMVRMRNIMIHEYDDVDLSLVWDTVQIDLPALVSALERIVPQKEK